MLAFTICAKNYLAKALVLRESFLEHNPKDSFFVVMADTIGSQEELKLITDVVGDADFVFFPELRNKLDFPRLEELLVKYDVTEFCTALKPFVFQYLFASQKDDVVLYLDPDMVVYDAFGVLKNFLHKHDIVLTSHCLRPKPKAEDDSTFLASGAYNLGFIALRDTENTKEFLSWWSERLLDYCYKEPRPYFTDQKWCDLVPSMFEGVGILKHAGYNVARWNLSERSLTIKDDKWFVNGEYPLVCYHFSQDRKNGTQSAPFELFYVYNTELTKVCNTELSQLAYYYDSIPGTDIPITTWRKRQQAGFATTADYQILRPCSDYQTVFTGKPPIDSFGLNLVGYFRTPNGTGQAARDFAKNLLSTGIPFAITALEPGPEQMGELEYYCTGNPIFDTTIFFVNADQLPAVAEKYPHLRREVNAAVFWWELDGWFPFKEAFDYVDHVITFSHFVQNALTGSVPDKIKLHYLSYPFRPLDPYRDYFYSYGCEFRRQMGVSLEDFLFGFSFDFNSCEERKNPLGLIEAFSNAFTLEDKVYLLLKMTNGTKEQVANLAGVASRSVMRERIRFITQNLSRYDHLSLMSGLNCYVSLHRSEGLGLGLMEAMAMGKPVIATAYGGNMDFMSSSNSYLVDYHKTEVKTDFKDYYPAGASWAEPNLVQAYLAMQYIYMNQEEAQNVGLSGQRQFKRRNANTFRQEIYSLLNSF